MDKNDAPTEQQTTLSKRVKELKAMVRDDLQSIIDFVGGTDSEITQFVNEIKKEWR